MVLQAKHLCMLSVREDCDNYEATFQTASKQSTIRYLLDTSS
jgi:hypothetical protein